MSWGPLWLILKLNTILMSIFSYNYLDRIKNERRQKFRERQKEQWAQIRSYRRNREEIKAEQRFHLHQELKASVRARRERALQDFIRVNLRRVMAEQKTLERKAYFAAKEEAEREQDARLETLRKATRRKLGLGSSQNAGKHTAFLPTVASASKIREKKATNIEDRLVGADEGAQSELKFKKKQKNHFRRAKIQFHYSKMGKNMARNPTQKKRV